MPIDSPSPGPNPNQGPGKTLEELEAEMLARVDPAIQFDLRTMRSPIHLKPRRSESDPRAPLIRDLDRRYGTDWLTRLCKLDLDALLGPPLDPSASLVNR